MKVMVKQRAHVQHIKKASHALVAELIHAYCTGTYDDQSKAKGRRNVF